MVILLRFIRASIGLCLFAIPIAIVGAGLGVVIGLVGVLALILFRAIRYVILGKVSEEHRKSDKELTRLFADLVSECFLIGLTVVTDSMIRE